MNQKHILEIIIILKKAYPDAKYYINFSNPVELLVAAILSAQVRDEVVNACTKDLFKKYKTAEDFAESDLKELTNDIKTITFAGNKAKNIKESCKILVERYNGKIPKTIEELTNLPGVGRKTANTILINTYGIVNGIPVDTHVIRLSYRLGWTKNKNPDKIEKDLDRIIPEKEWGKISYILKAHGRAICQALIPYCNKCPLNKLCPKNGVSKYN
ncbi:endonuclease III [Candidatus Woesearchaeota archaeon]|nr:endonuclease III [Candidatus Woesearchaeota archaeon]